MAEISLLPKSAFTEVLIRALHATDGIVGSRGHVYSNFIRRVVEKFSIPGTDAIPSGSDFNTGSLENASGNSTADSITSGNTLLGLPSEITVDNIISIKRFRYTGHVYDLQTLSTLYITNSVLSSNCLCSYSIDVDKDGNTHMTYDIALEACELCQAYARR
jgi:hypothetical protein